MWRTIIVVIVVLIIFLFIGDNMHTTRVNMPFTNGFEIRTVFLLALSFTVGYGTASLIGFIKKSKNNKK